jgi:hypothetical protein
MRIDRKTRIAVVSLEPAPLIRREHGIWRVVGFEDVARAIVDVIDERCDGAPIRRERVGDARVACDRIGLVIDVEGERTRVDARCEAPQFTDRVALE